MWPAVPTITDFIANSIVSVSTALLAMKSPARAKTSARNNLADSCRPPLRPLFQFRPKRDQSPVFETAANVDGQISFQRIRVVGSSSDQFDVSPELLESLLIVIENDHAITGVATRTP